MVGAYGIVLSADTLHFERSLPSPVERVWDHLTASAWIGGWLAPGAIEPREGGAVALQMVSAFGGSVAVQGEVSAWSPPSHLAYTWQETATVSRLTFDLETADDGARLSLRHENVPPEEMLGFASGWHACLDALALQLSGATEEDVRKAWLGEDVQTTRYKVQLAKYA